MSEKGFFGKLKDQIVGKKDKSLKLELGELGIRAITDERLARRIEIVRQLQEELQTPVSARTPISQVQQMFERLQKVNATVRTAGIPYLRGGDFDNSRLCLIGWENLYSLATDIIKTIMLTVQDKGKTMDKSEAVRKLFSFIEIEIILYAFYILDASFFERDVSPSSAAVIQPILPTQKQVLVGNIDDANQKPKEE
jgi:hypothetical protein